MGELIPAPDAKIGKACEIMTACIDDIRHNGHGSLTPLSGTKLPPFEAVERIGKGVAAALKRRTDAAQAADLIEVFIGTRAHTNLADPEKYLRAVRHLLVNEPPDVAAEAVHALVTRNKFMPEVAEIASALAAARGRRELLLHACREAYREYQRRADRARRQAEIDEERERNREDPVWQEWFREFRAGRHVTFDEFKAERAE